MNEVEYCTGCAISMIITCKIDYSIFFLFFCNIQSSSPLLPPLFLTITVLPPPSCFALLTRMEEGGGHRHAILEDRQIAFLLVPAVVVLAVSSIKW